MKTLIFAIGIAIVVSLGAVWLFATPGQTPSSHFELPADSTSPASSSASSSNLLSASTSTAATPTHSIDWVSIAPPSIASGSGEPVIITAEISDPAVIRNSVNLLYVSPTGTPQVIGALNDNGLNGDAVAAANIFTIVTSFAQYPVGTVNLRISAAFMGSLLRTQTGIFQLNVLPPVATSGWVTVTDSQRLFSIQAPSTWGLIATETPGDDPGTLKYVNIEFPDGTIVFTISVNTTSSWAAMQSGYSQGPVPVFIGKNSQYVFGQSGTQVPIIDEPVSAAEIAQTLPQTLASVHVF